MKVSNRKMFVSSDSVTTSFELIFSMDEKAKACIKLLSEAKHFLMKHDSQALYLVSILSTCLYRMLFWFFNLKVKIGNDKEIAQS